MPFMFTVSYRLPTPTITLVATLLTPSIGTKISLAPLENTVLVYGSFFIELYHTTNYVLPLFDIDPHIYFQLTDTHCDRV